MHGKTSWSTKEYFGDKTEEGLLILLLLLLLLTYATVTPLRKSVS